MEASQIHENISSVAYINRWVKPDDLVWTRDTVGWYYLARVTSGWEYWTTPEAEERDVDLANIFRCELRQVETVKVPGKVIACFRPSRCIQEICDGNALAYSQYLWNQLVGAPVYQLSSDVGLDVFMLLDSEELEDVVFLYLQHKGWYVVPNSRKGDTMSFEYLAVHPKTGEHAYTQVKSGHTKLNRDDYRSHPERLFLFQAYGEYSGEPREDIVCIPPDEIRSFLDVAYGWLPASIRLKLDIAKEVAVKQA